MMRMVSALFANGGRRNDVGVFSHLFDITFSPHLRETYEKYMIIGTLTNYPKAVSIVSRYTL